MLNAGLGTAAIASVWLGRYAQAEKLAHRWLAVPANPNSEADPRNRISSINAVLANANAMQGRNEEARKTLQQALEYYTAEQKAGADGTSFRHRYAYALYVSAISTPADAVGRKQRDAALNQATALIKRASEEARQLVEMRQIAGLIAAARTGSGS